MNDDTTRSNAPGLPARYCGEGLVIEQVVTTSYKLVCPVHGTYAHGLSLKEANEHRSCAMPVDPSESDEKETSTDA